MDGLETFNSDLIGKDQKKRFLVLNFLNLVLRSVFLGSVLSRLMDLLNVM